MPQRVHAILIAVPNPQGFQNNPVADAESAIEIFEKFLARRYSQLALRITSLKGSQGNVYAVRAAFQRIVKEALSGDLFIALFVGHGIPSNGGDHAYQAWALFDGNLTDIQLANYLRQIPNGVDNIIINGCCYGGGIHRWGHFPGDSSLLEKIYALVRSKAQRSLTESSLDLIDRLWPDRPSPYKPLDEDPMDAIARTWTNRLKALVVNDLSPMICISAAASNSIVHSSRILDFVELIISFAEKDSSYGALNDHFEAIAVTGLAFEVMARPSDRMSSLLFPPESSPTPKEDPSPQPAPSSRGQFRIAFINVSQDKPVNLTLELKQHIALDEMDSLGLSTGAKLDRISDHDFNCILTLQPGAIAGFMAETAVTVRNRSALIVVVAAQGKDPWPPPPPPTVRFQGMALVDYETKFASFLSGGAPLSNEAQEFAIDIRPALH